MKRHKKLFIALLKREAAHDNRPTIVYIVKIIIGKQYVAKINQVLLFGSTVQGRIVELNSDLSLTVVFKIKENPLLVLELDESTDVDSDSNTGTRCIKYGPLKEEQLV